MEKYSQRQIDEALRKVREMDHYTMCLMWRFQPPGTEIFFRSDLATGEAFQNRLFKHYGGFTPEISRLLGWG